MVRLIAVLTHFLKWTNVFSVPTINAPPTILPRVDGMKFLTTASATVTSAPWKNASGI